MNILIYGAGAVGGYVGGQLALSGHHVTLLARGAMGEALSSQGLTLLMADGAEHHIAVDGKRLSVATSAADAFAAASFDWVAFTMKAYDTVAAIHELEAVSKPPPPILCLQNGVGNEDSLVSAFGAERVVAGTLTTPVSVVEPGVLQEERVRGVALIGGLDATRPMLKALRQTALDVQITDNPDALKWSKLLLNQLGNATSAILDLTPGEVFARRELFAIERAALIETLSVMHARGIATVNLPGVPARTLARMVGLLPAPLLRAVMQPQVRRGRGDKMPSFHGDLAHGRRRSEVIWLNGAVARAADAIGLVAPVNHVLALTLMDIVEGRARWEQFRGKPEMLLAALRIAK